MKEIIKSFMAGLCECTVWVEEFPSDVFLDRYYADPDDAAAYDFGPDFEYSYCCQITYGHDGHKDLVSKIEHFFYTEDGFCIRDDARALADARAWALSVHQDVRLQSLTLELEYLENEAERVRAVLSRIAPSI